MVVHQPRPPGSLYAPPKMGLRVSTTAELVAALGRGEPETILVEPGTYTHGEVVVFGSAHQVWATRQGRVKLGFGLQAYKQEGVGVHGIDWVNTDPAATFADTALHISGGHAHWVSDVRIHGRRVLATGVWLDAPDSSIRRIVVDSTRHFGVLARGGRVELSDIQTGHVRDHEDQRGEREHGIHLEGSVLVERVFDRASMIGIWTGGPECTGRLEHLNLGLSATAGIYHEHLTGPLSVEWFRVAAPCRVGIEVEEARVSEGYISGPIEWRNGDIVSGWKDQEYEHYGFGLWGGHDNQSLALSRVAIHGMHGWALPRGDAQVSNVDTTRCAGTKQRWL